ncbi:Hpt domain-containing protein [Aquimonas voraii]|uniref:Chemotaxis protein CheA n=1 Tax=Aquimonas voraii TaxID=265719 RepID=A0A1G6SW59_9GAMM|nr:Hpt domain-containing protein [Aquimonas voraii]SDD21190.1 chemosensory pili system protein ChpA (sensor histidine kinase/response regulator) [Aquimonas voraii]
MRLQDDIDFTTLTWVKGELDETLKQARLALEAFVEDPDDASQMRFCATYLHQVQGTLRMVELYGAAMVTEEMEHLATALQNRQVSALDEAYAVLMRGIVQLPDYLERLQSGHKDIPIVLLPLLNDLRAARGEKGLPESALFAPDLSQPLPGSAAGPAVPLPELELRQLGGVARSQFQIALLRWFKGQDEDANLARMVEVCDRLVSTITQEEGRRLFWVAGSVIHGVRSGEIEASAALKQTVGRVEREIKHLADAGETGFRVDPPRELTRNLLYFIAHGRASSDRLVEVRQAFRLDMFVPTAEEFEDARRSISGHNRALLDTVAGAIREDLLRVKDALDLYLRKPDAQPGELSGQVDVLDRVGDTLGMLGLGVPRRVVMEQRDVVSLVAQGQRPADESTLLDIAGALLYVEATLDDQVQQLGSPHAQTGAAEALPRTEARKVLEAVLKEAQSNFAQAKQCFVAFVESNWDHAQLTDVPRLLEEVAGAGRMLDLGDAAALLHAVGRFTAVELVQHRRVPNGQQMDTLADALASLEYYLESVREQRGDRTKILDLARERLTQLGYWPVPEHALSAPEAEIPVAPQDAAEQAAAVEAFNTEADAPVVAHDGHAAEGLVVDSGVPEHPQVPDLASLGAVDVVPGEDLSDLVVGETAAQALQPAREVHDLAGFMPAETESTRPPAAPAGKEIVGFQLGAEDIDEEIREVFVEEVQEEIDNLRQLLPAWQANPEDVESLKPIRRVFHTLKGSGRLVGAMVLGEFAWKIENMLNRVLDKSIAAGPEVVSLVAETRDVLPRLLAALRGETGQYADLEGIEQVAEALASGQLVQYRPQPLVAEVPETEAPLGQTLAGTASGDVQAEAEAEAAELEPAEEIVVAEEVIDLSPEDAAAIEALLSGASAGQEHADDVSPSVLEDALTPDVSSPQPAEPAADERSPDAHTEEATALTEMPLPGLEEAPQSEAAIGPEVPVESWSIEPVVEDAADAPDAVEASALDAGGAIESLVPADLSAGFELAEEEPAGNLVLIDPDLFEILKAEVAGHLDTVEAYLTRSAGAPQPVQESLLRAVHTISGAFAMTEVEVGTELAWPLEGYIKRLLAQSAAPSQIGFDCIEEAAQALRALMIELDQPMPRPARHTRLAQRISALRDALPEPTRPVIDVGIEDELAAETQAIPGMEATSSAGADVSAAAPMEAKTEPAVPVEPVFLAEEASASEIGDSGELSFAFELESSEPFDPEAQAQSADLEIIETEGGAPSPYWSDTESVSLQPSVDSSLTLDELGEAEAADAWLAEFEKQVAGEAAQAALPGETSAVDLVAESEADRAVAASDMSETLLSDHEDELLIRSLLAESEPTQPAFEDMAAAQPIAEANGGSDSLDGGSELAAESEAHEALERVAGPQAPEGEALPETISLEALELIEFDAPGESTLEPALRDEVIVPESNLLEPDSSEAMGEDLTPATLEHSATSAEELGFEALELEEPNLESSATEAVAELGEQGFEAEGYPEAESTTAEEAPSALPPVALETDDIVIVEQAVLEDLDRIGGEPALQEAISEPSISAPPAAAAGGKLAIPADADPEGPLDLTDVDADLLDVFLEEGVDILDHSDGLMSRLRDAPHEQELVIGLQRDLHTLKGGARMAGLNPIGDLAHATESLLEAVAAGGRDLGTVGVEVLERAFDRLHNLVSRVGERRAIATPVHLLAAVETLLRGETLPTVSTEPSAVEAAPSVVEAPAVAAKAPAPIRFIPTETALDEEETVSRAPQEQIRIRADLLDRLVNYAGEVAIYRARLEQQLGAFRGNLGELDQTTTRLREQLRKLEIETEAQILSRYQRQQDEGDAEFDPLELDRFSTLQQLSRALSESAADIINLQHTLEDLTRQYETLLLQQSRVSSDLQEGLMRTRMVPFDSLVPRLRRILRQTAGELGKQAQLKVEGAQGEMDRNVLDRMTAPLEHMLRNAVAHGMESPDERRAAGKPAEGTIRITVAREASEVLIRVIDDGRGLDRDAIRRKAIERGLMKPDAQLGDRDLYGFILESGFSTAQTVSKIAGRGVGMDVVYSEIRQLGGSLHIESERGRGTEFVIRLPFTLAVTQAVFVKQGETSYAIPITSVQGVSRIDRAELDKQLASGSPSFSYAGEDYAIHDLGLLLGQPAAKAADSLQVPVLLARSGDQRAAICVDNVLGSREIVVKPTGPQVSSIPGIFGATIMGDGRVVVILDVAPLVRRAAAIEHAIEPVAPEDQRVVPLVMVVDDSITMRKVTGRVLERHNFEVITAKDGVDAIEKLAERVPDVMLLDIEMPRMDGYELATHMRNDARLKSVPIIMITSRTGDKHRQRAFEIGVDRYLGKPYQEADLMRNVQEILQVRRERGR